MDRICTFRAQRDDVLGARPLRATTVLRCGVLDERWEVWRYETCGYAAVFRRAAASGAGSPPAWYKTFFLRAHSTIRTLPRISSMRCLCCS
jgi:hypothetical protein